MKRDRGRIVRLVGLGLLFAAMMAVNLKVGLSSGSASGSKKVSLLGLSMQLSVPTAVASTNDAGTCCIQTASKCIVGTIIVDNHYYKKEGRCP